MPKQSEFDRFFSNLKQLFAELPWWIGPPVIVFIWLVFYLVIPAAATLLPNSGLATPASLTALSRNLAPIFAIAAAAVWIVALLEKATNRHRLDKRSDPDSIRAMSWRDFENLLDEAFRRQGYSVRKTPSGADGGMDLILNRDGAETIVQAKHWKARSVGVRIVRELHGVRAARNASDAIIVSSGTFTRDARSFATDSSVRLIDGPELQRMLAPIRRMQRPKPSPATAPAPIAPGAQLRSDQAAIAVAPAGVAALSPPICPRCNQPMLKRTARRGPSAGSTFWGCANFPQCRATRPID